MFISDDQIDKNNTSIVFYQTNQSVRVTTDETDPASAVSVEWFNKHKPEDNVLPTSPSTFDDVTREVASIFQNQFGYNAGMSDVYREKYDQAIEYLSQIDPDAGTFPLLVVTAKWKQISLVEAAELIIKARKNWLRFACAAEEILLQAKRDFGDAADTCTRSEIVVRAIQQLRAESNESRY